MAGANEKRTVVYIDDSAVERELVCRLLESEDCEVVATASPQTGLELVRRMTPDLILLDLHMPEMDGCEVLERMRDIPALRHVPIVAVSATIGEEERKEIFFRFDGFIKKPIDVEALPGKIQAYIEQGRRGVPASARGGKGREKEGAGVAVPSGGASGSGGRALAGTGADNGILDVLETLERMRTIMSHDLRSPLTVMISYAGTVGKGKAGELSERQSEMLDLVVEQGFKMDELISELVRIAKEALDRHGWHGGQA